MRIQYFRTTNGKINNILAGTQNNLLSSKKDVSCPVKSVNILPKIVYSDNILNGLLKIFPLNKQRTFKEEEVT